MNVKAFAQNKNGKVVANFCSPFL